MGWVFLLEGNIHEAVSSLSVSIEMLEKMRGFLRDVDEYKISLLDEHGSPYLLLSELYCVTGKHNEALYVVEFGRASALADIMSAQYSVEKEISVNPQSWVGIEKIMKKESSCTCLYISYSGQCIFLWILKPSTTIVLRLVDVNGCFSNKIVRSVDNVFADEALRNSFILPHDHCEDRSLFPANAGHLPHVSSEKNSLEASRLVEEEEDENEHPEQPTLAQCYQMIIAPVTDLLEEAEIIIVPDRVFYKVPFAALKDENEKYLSETFRIRIVPSLTTLKLIQDSPADYHSQTGALIVGEPGVTRVYYKGSVEKLCPLPGARKEAEMIGRLVGAQPLLGEYATKQAVLQSIHSVSLIHFAAHGNAERGEIALAPSRSTYRIPQEQEYLLTMAEISQVRLRAKLVVLSCCHSARGQIRSEGVVGIARAFLGSGARSVLVALWALEDEATEQFMSRFYKHLVRGESASESLHQAMKWMRGNGYSDVGQWAPFMLIGDNVTFDFKK